MGLSIHARRDHMNDWEIPEHQCQEFSKAKTRFCVVIPVMGDSTGLNQQLTKMKPLTSMADILLVAAGSFETSSAAAMKKLGVRMLIVKHGSSECSSQTRLGLAYAMEQGYEGVVVLDGTNRENALSIPRFLAELANGADMVQGSRFMPGGKPRGTPWFPWLMNRILHTPVISMLTGFRFTDTMTGFRGYSRRLLVDPLVRPFRNEFVTDELPTYLLIRSVQLGFNVGEIPVESSGVSTGNMNTLIKACWGMFNPGETATMAQRPTKVTPNRATAKKKTAPKSKRRKKSSR